MKRFEGARQAMTIEGTLTGTLAEARELLDLARARNIAPIPTRNRPLGEATVGLARPLARPRLAARIIQIETDAAKRLPAAMRTAFHVAAVLVILADTGTAVGTVFHRSRTCHSSPRPRFRLTARRVCVLIRCTGDRRRPVFDDRFLRVADVEQSVAHQIAQHYPRRVPIHD
jgi:hypothetical protein